MRSAADVSCQAAWSRAYICTFYGIVDSEAVEMKELPGKVSKMASKAEETISTSYAQLAALRTAIAALGALGLPFSFVAALDSLLTTRGQNGT